MVMLVALPASLLLERSLSQDLVQRIESDLTSRATMARTLGSGLSIDELDDLAKTIGKADEVRFTWVGPDGRVLGDSWVARDDLGSLDNHADRPEIETANRIGLGIARRSSETTGADLLYVAVRGDPRHGGAVRVAMPLTGVDGDRKLAGSPAHRGCPRVRPCDCGLHYRCPACSQGVREPGLRGQQARG